jgi:serine O-acetyltransferase
MRRGSRFPRSGSVHQKCRFSASVPGNTRSATLWLTITGTGKETGDRHPKIRQGVLIGAGAKILGNIEVGHCSRVAACSVVLHDVPPNRTVAGVPAKIVGFAGCEEPARAMDHLVLGVAELLE